MDISSRRVKEARRVLSGREKQALSAPCTTPVLDLTNPVSFKP